VETPALELTINLTLRLSGTPAPAADETPDERPATARADAAADCAAMRDDPTADMERMIREALEGSAPTITIRDLPADRPGCDCLACRLTRRLRAQAPPRPECQCPFCTAARVARQAAAEL
jgi:hypothetical protein